MRSWPGASRGGRAAAGRGSEVPAGARPVPRAPGAAGPGRGSGSLGRLPGAPGLLRAPSPGGSRP